MHGRTQCNRDYATFQRDADFLDESDMDKLWAYVADLEWAERRVALNICRYSAKPSGGVEKYTRIRAAGVPHEYLCGLRITYVTSWDTETAVTNIVGLWNAGVSSEYTNKLISWFSIKDIIRLHEAGVSFGYADACEEAGLTVEQIVAAYSANIPLEYATA